MDVAPGHGIVETGAGHLAVLEMCFGVILIALKLSGPWWHVACVRDTGLQHVPSLHGVSEPASQSLWQEMARICCSVGIVLADAESGGTG